MQSVIYGSTRLRAIVIDLYKKVHSTSYTIDGMLCANVYI